ncbi:2'-5' RNA ligase family protein [Flavobacterium sp. ov086]|uniref:2'-5' RNA ligase family protein n=1 Tax=Flavobacterium sp. ov086 TaxID=1761785 RepID=UPI000B6BFA2F|nr:2'-5' RNA ligase family protein [Flavobacterium sp. ov086]SNR57881.1 2'-5' RNA ligase [Flavobacterium sp. ov086]
MNLQEHYNELYKQSSEAILAGNYKLDSQINDQNDSRFGITLLIRPNEVIKANIQLFLNELKAIDPLQYYYPNSDIHITAMSIISCYEGFSLDKVSIPDYVEIIQKSLLDLNEIKIEFRGVTASPSAIMIQGFPTDESLNNLRDKLRENFKKSTLEQSIDSRYAISTAHVTVVRFQEKLQTPEKLIAITEKFRDFDFGTFTVDKIELVYNDWYQREKNTIQLADFHL